jgi:hypothetical protein
MRRGQSGISSRFTAQQIAEVRAIDREYRQIARRRQAMAAELGMTRDDWSRYARGILGKKPAGSA